MSSPADLQKRSRLALILFVAVALTVTSLGFYAVGSARANTEIERVRKRATVVSIRVADLAASTYLNTPNPIATALGVDQLSISLKLRKQQWCVTIQVRRLLATRTTLFMLNRSGSLSPIDQCPPPS